MDYTNIDTGVFKHKPFDCPYGCGYKINASGSIDGKNITPSTGDLALCVRCGGLLEMSVLGDWVVLTDLNKNKIMKEAPKLWEELLNTQHLIHTFNKAN